LKIERRYTEKEGKHEGRREYGNKGERKKTKEGEKYEKSGFRRGIWKCK
jgi:hypothetical protein